MESTLTEALDIDEVRKNHNYRPVSRFISETIQDRVTVTLVARQDLVFQFLSRSTRLQAPGMYPACFGARPKPG